MKHKLPEFRILFLLFYTLSVCFISSCAGKKMISSSSDSPVPNTLSSKAEPEFFPYFVYKDGSYIETELDKKPEVIGGIESMYRDIKYPALARENGIQGTVVVTVTINELGQLEDALITRHVGGGCDEEALRVVKIHGQQGFVPAEINGIPVKVRYGIPLRFILQ
ncbi:MAG TPA: energy transducer TonB [Saprospiraceae bacterium]|nr:energy transducer TonB [Saprospiraceae bacterium]